MTSRRLLVVSTVACLALGGAALWQWRGGAGDAGDGSPSGETADSPPELPAPESRFRNAEAGYVGSTVCAECHQQEAESHGRTQHARALRVADDFPPRPAGGCQHRLSGRRYEVYLDDQQRMRHRELVPDAEGNAVVVLDVAPTLVVGSGTKALTYFYERDGFHFESPVTWFRSRDGWDMSPGFEKLNDQPGFSRMATATCMNCHTGGVEPLDEGPFRFAIREPAIGCERCHGPGELHVSKHRQAEPDSQQASGDGDDTIVHPARLSRERLGAVCSQCHLESAARVRHRGRLVGSFRPGHRFTDHELAFQLAAGREEMKVVGHAEQMRLSKCFQKSEMTCVTCHNPHQPPPAERRMEHFRQQCLECHQADSCGLEHERRLQQSADDNCMQCHMPQGDVDLVHLAYTHHRIGIHEPGSEFGEADPAAEDADELPRLSPIHDTSHLATIEVDRAKGIAYLELAAAQATRRGAEQYGRRARELLEQVRAAGLEDGDVEASLARINFADGKLSDAVRDAKSALGRDSLSPAKRVDSLEVLAELYFSQQNFKAAASYYQQLCELRRFANDWRELAACRFETGDSAAALRAAEMAFGIAPHRADLAYDLSDLHFDLGNQAKSKKYERRAQLLERAPIRD